MDYLSHGEEAHTIWISETVLFIEGAHQWEFVYTHFIGEYISNHMRSCMINTVAHSSPSPFFRWDSRKWNLERVFSDTHFEIRKPCWHFDWMLVFIRAKNLVETLAQSRSCYQRTLFSIYAGASWEVTTSESNLLLLWLSSCLLSPGFHHQPSFLLGSLLWRWQQHLAVSALSNMHCRVDITMTSEKSATADPHDRWIFIVSYFLLDLPLGLCL